MKRVLSLILVLASVLTLAACGKVLENTAKDYYAVGQFNGWGDAIGKEEYKMVAIKSSDDRVKSIKSQLKDATALYILQVVFPETAAGWHVTYTVDGTAKDFDGNLTIKIVRTLAGDKDSIDFWAENKESGLVKNLTIDTLIVPTYREVDDVKDGLGTWGDNPCVKAAGTYNVVFVEYKDGSLAMGAIKVA